MRFITSLLAVVAVNAQYPVYTIDFDEPAETRYNKMFEDLREPLLEMENYWYSQIPEESRSIIEENMDLYASV